MSVSKMHAHEVDTDVSLVRRLVAAQFPRWADLPISPVRSTARGTFRDVLNVDDGTRERARGFALHQAAMIIPYYGETNPAFVALAKRTVEEILADINA